MLFSSAHVFCSYLLLSVCMSIVVVWCYMMEETIDTPTGTSIRSGCDNPAGCVVVIINDNTVMYRSVRKC